MKTAARAVAVPLGLSLCFMLGICLAFAGGVLTGIGVALAFVPLAAVCGAALYRRRQENRQTEGA